MGFKARELEGMSKAELIKALRALMAREAKLKKKYDGLLDQLAKRACEPPPDDLDHGVVHVTQEEFRKVNQGDQDRDDLAAAQEPAAVAERLAGPFPWEPK